MVASIDTRVIHGVRVPSLIYGTAWKEARTLELTRLALRAGFGAIDTANQRRHYAESLVGDALAAELGQAFQSREELFVQSKFTYVDSQDERVPYDKEAPLEAQVLQSFESSLSHLQTSYLDCYLLHGPSHRSRLSDSDQRVWRAIESLQASGRTRLIGISNVSVAQLEQLWEYAHVKPAFVQNRCYARTGWDRSVRAFCKAHDIGYQGFSLLTANAKELSRPEVERIRARLGVTLAELVFAFALQSGMFALTGTSQLDHMQKDLAASSLELEPAELRTIESLAD